MQTRIGMSNFVNLRLFTAFGCIAGMLVTLALPAHAQSEASEQSQASAPTAPSGQTEPSAKTEPTTQSDQSAKTKIEQVAKTEQAAPPMPAAPNGSLIEAFIAKLDGATRAIHENSKKDPALIREGCRELLNEILDLNAMAQASNAEIWDQMTLPQRGTLRLAFEHRMVGNCVRQFGGYEGEYLQLAGVRTTDGGDLLATIRVGSQDGGKLVTWRLHGSHAGNWRAVDVITEGRSVVLDARTEFAAVLQSVNGDIEALIAFMQK